MKLDPLYKWTGGKRKEIKIFQEYYPTFVKDGSKYLYVEPFFGGGAVYWSLNAHENIINDVDSELINFMQQIKLSPDWMLDKVQDLAKELKTITTKEKLKEITISQAKNHRGKFYYELRNLDKNGGLNNISNQNRAYRFYVVNQLAFNGMRRFNSSGEFNIPYGNYKTISLNITPEHKNLLQRTEIFQGDYSHIMKQNDTENTFIYLDPPYTREFNEYSHGHSFDLDKQRELKNIIVSMKHAKVMLIINSDEFTRELYNGFIVHKYSLKYATNIKNRYNNEVEHLVICNY